MEKRWRTSLTEVWQRTQSFTIASGLLLIVGVYVWQLTSKGHDLLWFNSWRGTWTDLLFVYGTLLGEEHSYIVLTILFFFWRKKDSWWLPLTGLVVTIVSFLLKLFFRVPRPGAHKHESWFEDLLFVEGVRPLTGMTSLPSGHTMSAYALAFMLVYLVPLKRGLWLIPLAFATIVGISRMYLVLHFLEDVLFGASIGLVVGYSLATIHHYYKRESSSPALSSNK